MARMDLLLDTDGNVYVDVSTTEIRQESWIAKMSRKDNPIWNVDIARFVSEDANRSEDGETVNLSYMRLVNRGRTIGLIVPPHQAAGSAAPSLDIDDVFGADEGAENGEDDGADDDGEDGEDEAVQDEDEEAAA